MSVLIGVAEFAFLIAVLQLLRDDLQLMCPCVEKDRRAESVEILTVKAHPSKNT